MADYNAGSAGILIRPNMDGFVRELSAQLEAVPGQVEVDLHADTDKFSRELAASLEEIEQRYGHLTIDVEADTAEAARRIQALDGDHQVVVDVDADVDSAVARLEALEANRRMVLDVDADTTAARARIGDLGVGQKVHVDVDADTAAATAKIAAASRDRTSHINVDVDGGVASLARLGMSTATVGMQAMGAGLQFTAMSMTAMSAVGAITAAVGLAGGAIGGLGIGLIGVGATALPVVGAIALGIDGIKNAAQAAAPAFSALKESVSGAFSETLAPTFQAVGEALTAWTPSLTAVASSLANVADGFLSVFTTGQGLPIVGAFLQQVSTMVDSMGLGLVQLGSGLLTVMGSISPYLGQIGAGLGAIFGAVGTAFTQMQAAGTLTPICANLGNVLGSVGSLLGSILQALGTMGAAVMPALAPLFTSLGQMVQTIAGPLGQLGATIAQALTPVLPVIGQLASTLMTALQPVIPVLGQILQTVGGALTQAFQAIAPAIQPMAQAFGQVVSALAPFLPMIGQIIGALASALAPALSGVATALAPVIQALTSAMGPVIQALTPVLQQMAGVIGQVAGQIGGMLLQAITAITPFMPQIAQAFAQILQAVMPLIPQLMQIAMTIVSALIPVVVGFVPVGVMLVQAFAGIISVVGRVIGVFLQVVQWLANLTASIIGFVTGGTTHFHQLWSTVTQGFSRMISTVVGAVSGWVSSVIGFFSNLHTQAWAKAREMWNSVSSSFSEGVGRAVRFVSEMPGKITAIFSGAARWLYNAGRDVVTGLINGLTDMLSEAYNRVKDMASNIANVAKDALGIASPSRVFMEIGRFVNEGMALGIEQTSAKPAKSISDTVGSVFGTATAHVARGMGVDAAQLQVQAARPGQFSGAGGPRSDSNIVAISNGEYIVNADATHRNLPALEAMNGGRKIEGFAAGGAPGRAKVNEQQLDRFARGIEGKPYVWGGVNWGDCSGSMSALARFATGLAPFGGRFATGNEGEALRGMGFENGRWEKGYLAIGWLNGGPAGGHTAGTLPNGTHVEMGGGRGNGQYGGRAAGSNDAYFGTGHMRIKVADPFTPKIPGRLSANGTATPSVNLGASTSTLSGAGMTSATATPQQPKTWSELAGSLAQKAVSGQVSDALGVFGIPDQMPPILQAFRELSSDGKTSTWDVAQAAAEVKKLDFQVQTSSKLVEEAQSAYTAVRNSPAGDPLRSAMVEAQRKLEEMRRQLAELKKRRDEAQRRLEQLRKEHDAAQKQSVQGANLADAGMSNGQIQTLAATNPTLAAQAQIRPMVKAPTQDATRHVYDPKGGAEQWRPMVRAAMAKQGFGNNKAEEDAWVRQIKSESNGNPNIAQQIVDVNGTGEKAGVGLGQMIPGTWQAYRDKSLPDNRRDPWAMTNAMVRYGHQKYGGRLLGVIGHGHGYATGGTILGGTGVRDDVMIRAMGGEEMVRRTSAEASRPLLQAMNSSPQFAAALNSAFVSRGNSEVSTEHIATTTFNIAAGDAADAFQQARLEDNRRQLTYLGGR